MLLNMDGFDDNTASAFYGANSWDTDFTTSPTSPFSPNANASVVGNHTGSNLHSTDQTLYVTDPSRSLISESTMPLAPSREDASWQMYLSSSLSDSLHSLDLDMLNPNNSVDLVYPQHALANYAEFETLESPRSSGGYQSTQTVVNDDVQRMFCTTTPVVAPQPRIIQPALLSLIPTQDTANSLLLAQGEGSTKADELTVYPATISDVGVLTAPQFDTYLAQSVPSTSSSRLSSSCVRDPTITKLVNHSSTSTRPRRGLSGWGNTSHLQLPTLPSSTTTMPVPVHQKPPSTSSSISINNNSGLMVPDSISPSLCSSTRGDSSRNSERLLKRSRHSDDSLPILKRASKTRRIVVADVDTEDDSVDNNNGDDSDSDDYRPSRSPSLNPSRRSISPSSHSFVFKSETGVGSSTSFNNSRKKKARKVKGKAKGSAALALAVVSQMVRNNNPTAAGRRADIDLSSTRSTTGITRRKNQPIPLPIPVPNLHKKSRGRKVPHVVNNDSNNTIMKRKSTSSTKVYVKQEEDLDDDDDDDDGSGDEFEVKSRSYSSSTRSRRKKSTTSTTASEMSKTPSGENRTFICVVPGCGKCFVRSEHLKRHVRSIHTHDKREFYLFLFFLSLYVS